MASSWFFILQLQAAYILEGGNKCLDSIFRLRLGTCAGYGNINLQFSWEASLLKRLLRSWRGLCYMKLRKPKRNERNKYTNKWKVKVPQRPGTTSYRRDELRCDSRNIQIKWFILSFYSKTCQVDHLHKVTTCWCWPHIGRTGKVLCSLHIRPPP